MEERLRFDTLEKEHAKANAKPENVAQNTARYQAFLKALADAETESKAKQVDTDFAKMRASMGALYADAEVRAGLCVLYVSSKTARTALDMIFERLIQSFKNDTTIVSTTEIPFEALMLR